jgi:hypothetical protein
MRYGSRPPEWPSGLFQPRRTPLAQRAARAAAVGAGRLVVAGAKRSDPRHHIGEEHGRRRGLFVLAVAFIAQVAVIPLHWMHRYIATTCLVVALCLLPVWWRAYAWPLPPGWGQRRKVWPKWRRVYTAVTCGALLAYLPLGALWLPPWCGIGAWWMPAFVPATLVAVALWAWLYRGHYRIRDVEEGPEPVEDYGAAELWADEIGAAGKLLPGSVLTAVRDIEAPA